MLLPLNNPHGYANNWRYLNMATYSEAIEGQSVGDSSHLLADPDVVEAFESWVKRTGPAVRAPAKPRSSTRRVTTFGGLSLAKPGQTSSRKQENVRMGFMLFVLPLATVSACA